MRKRDFNLRRTGWHTWTTVLFLALVVLAWGCPVSTSSVVSAVLPLDEEFAPLLSFEPNQGQTRREVEFLARSAGSTLFLMPRAVVITFEPPLVEASSPARENTVTMSLVGGTRLAKATGEKELPGRSSYFQGGDERNWRTGIPTFRQVRIAGVYPGIDLSYLGAQGRLEYVFAVSPNADPTQIALEIKGVDELSFVAEGSLGAKGMHHELEFLRPVAYQEGLGGKTDVAVKYRLISKNRVGVVTGAYDRSKNLFIHPVLRYAGSASGRRH